MSNFIKNGVFYRGYNECRDLPTIEFTLEELIPLLNRVPYIVTFSSCGGHLFEPVKYNKLRIKSIIDFEVYDEKLAEKFILNVLKSNHTFEETFEEYPSSFVYISKIYTCYNTLDKLVWAYQMSIVGFSDNEISTRKNQLQKIEELKQIVNNEINPIFNLNT